MTPEQIISMIDAEARKFAYTTLLSRTSGDEYQFGVAVGFVKGLDRAKGLIVDAYAEERKKERE